MANTIEYEELDLLPDEDLELLSVLSKRKPKEEAAPIVFKSGDKGDTKILSNFYPSVIFYEGKAYPSAEHLYQWLKVNTIPDVAERNRQQQKIMMSPHAKDAKKYGSRAHTNPNYREHVKRYVDTNGKKIMKKVVYVKFVPKGPMRIYLLSTGDKMLYERMGGREKNSIWVGPNGLLGKLLMDLREYLSDPGNVVTEENWDYYKEYGVDGLGLTTCESCGRQWDGYAQCDCEFRDLHLQRLINK